MTVEAADGRAGRVARPTLEDLFGDVGGSDPGAGQTAADMSRSDRGATGAGTMPGGVTPTGTRRMRT